MKREEIQELTKQDWKDYVQGKNLRGTPSDNTVVIHGVPFDFTIHDDEILQGNIVFETDDVQEVYKYYADTWDDVLTSLVNYFELKQATSTNTHVKAVWFEKVEQRK